MSRFRGKKADLSLSINAIVVLILAITMLGLGLAFMRGMFSNTVNQFTSISDSLKKQVADDLKSSNERVAFNQVDVNVKRGEKKEVIFGIKNDDETGGKDKTFQIYTSCFKAISDDPNINLDNIALSTLDSVIVEPADVSVVKLILKPSSQTVSTSYLCEVCVTRDSSRGTCEPGPENFHARKEFYINVQ